MASPHAEQDRGITHLVARMADSLARLVTEHITLARLELADDAKQMGAQLAKIIVFVPFVLLGYALLCVALALLLADTLGARLAFAAVGLGNLLLGGLGIAVALQRLRGRHVMSGSLDELHRSAGALNAPRSISSLESTHAP